MAEQPRRMRVGEATVTIINVGDLRFSLRDEMAVPEEEWRPAHADVFAAPLVFPSQCFHVAAPGLSLMVDAGRYDVPEGSGFAIPGYAPPLALADQLAAAGIRTEDVQYVIITHAHWDHFNGVTRAVNGAADEPTFPNARHLLGRADWEDAEMRAEVERPESLQGRTLGVLQRAGLLEPVEGDGDLGGGVRLVATPGESPGHMAVRVESRGQVVYCVGDLYHHPVEVERPDWMATWADRTATLASRARLAEAALAEDARLLAAHIASVGRLARIGEGVRWVDVG
jgi:glyoxylase-like metal-dependent hydrolase (beta-lactamase superfamily II)